jgi:hypothetical protein
MLFMDLKQQSCKIAAMTFILVFVSLSLFPFVISGSVDIHEPAKLRY